MRSNISLNTDAQGHPLLRSHLSSVAGQLCVEAVKELPEIFLQLPNQEFDLIERRKSVDRASRKGSRASPKYELRKV